MVQSLLLCFYFTDHRDTYAQKIIALLSTPPMKYFKKFLRSTVNAQCQRDEKPNTNVVAETMKFLANSSNGYQIMDCFGYWNTNYTVDEKTHAATNNAIFKKLGYINDQLYEVEFAKPEIEHKELILVDFFIVQYAKLRMLELYYNFFHKVLWYRQVLGHVNTYRFTVTSISRKRIVWLYTKWEKAIVGIVTQQRL